MEYKSNKSYAHCSLRELKDFMENVCLDIVKCSM